MSPPKTPIALAAKGPWLLVPAALAALVLGGCGGGGGETTSAPATTAEEPTQLSKAELIKQGDAICAEVNAAVGTVEASEAETSSQVSQAADLYNGMVERLKALGTPTEGAGYAEFTEAADQLAKAESDARLASERGDEAGLAEAQGRVGEALEAFQEAASAFGFEKCAEAPSAPAVTPSGGGEEAPVEEAAPEEAPVEEAAPEEVVPETGGGTEGGGTGAGGEEAGGGSGGIGAG
jgi:hypothetical protein